MRGLDRDHRPGAPPAAAGFGPDGLPSALVLTFDNLGEASELERGTWPNNQPVGRHASAKEILPRLLHELDGLGLKATFFVEAINCELYPAELLEIVARGDELGMHGWRQRESVRRSQGACGRSHPWGSRWPAFARLGDGSRRGRRRCCARPDCAGARPSGADSVCVMALRMCHSTGSSSTHTT